MDGIYYEKILNRIIQGRLRIRLDDLVLFISEPDRHIIEESFDIYEEARKKAYFSGCYLEEEVVGILVANDLWTPRDDREADKMMEEIDKLKVQAFKSFYRKKELVAIKRKIRQFENSAAILKSKRSSLKHLSCEGVADFARKCWIISQTTRTTNGDLYDFSDVGVKDVLDIYVENTLKPADIRYIARTAPWRQMWSGSKKRDNAFGKPSVDLDVNQLALVSYSQMYDNVFESPDSPSEQILEDDDCLDGWFIVQREKYDKDKKEKQVDETLSDKVKGSQEIMLMARTPEEAKEIYDLNSVGARQVIRQRQHDIDNFQGENMSFKELTDVKQDRLMNARNQATQQIKDRGRG